MFEFYSAVTSLNGGDMLGLCAFCTLFLRDIEAVDLPFSPPPLAPPCGVVECGWIVSSHSYPY